MAGELTTQETQANQQKSPDKEAPAAKQEIHTALVVQPQNPAKAKELEKSGQTILETSSGLRMLPTEVVDALLPMPVLQTVRQPEASVFAPLKMPDGHTYDGGPGLPVHSGPMIAPADEAVAQFAQGIDDGSNGGAQMYEQFQIYCKSLTVGMGDSWQHFQQEMQNSHDPTKLSWDDAQSHKEQGGNITENRTQLSQMAKEELDAIAAVQERRREMVNLIAELGALNKALEQTQLEKDLDETQTSLINAEASVNTAKAKEASEISTIDSILSLGLAIGGASSTVAAGLEVGKAITKPVSAYLYKIIFKNGEVERLQTEVKRLSDQKDRLKNNLHLLKTQTIQEQMVSVFDQMDHLTGEMETTFDSIKTSMESSNSSVSSLSGNANLAAADMQSCGGKTKKCETQEGDYQSMAIFSEVRGQVTQAIPQLLKSTQDYQAAHEQYQIPTKARRAVDFARQHGPKFVPKDPALEPQYAQFRESSGRAVQLFEYWANFAESELSNSKEIANHVAEFKGQKAMIKMQVRFSQEMTSEANKLNKRY